MDNQAMFTAQQMQYNKMYAGMDPSRWVSILKKNLSSTVQKIYQIIIACFLHSFILMEKDILQHFNGNFATKSKIQNVIESELHNLMSQFENVM